MASTSAKAIRGKPIGIGSPVGSPMVDSQTKSSDVAGGSTFTKGMISLANIPRDPSQVSIPWYLWWKTQVNNEFTQSKANTVT